MDMLRPKQQRHTMKTGTISANRAITLDSISFICYFISTFTLGC